MQTAKMIATVETIAIFQCVPTSAVSGEWLMIELPEIPSIAGTWMSLCRHSRQPPLRIQSPPRSNIMVPSFIFRSSMR